MFAISFQNGQKAIIRTFLALNMRFLPLSDARIFRQIARSWPKLYCLSCCACTSKWKIKPSLHIRLGKNVWNRAFFVALLECHKSFGTEEVIVIFGEEFSRLDQTSFGKFYWPIIFLWFFDDQNFEKFISHKWRAESKISINTKDSP